MLIAEKSANLFLGFYKKLLAEQVNFPIKNIQDYGVARDHLLSDHDYLDELLESNAKSSQIVQDFFSSIRHYKKSQFLFFRNLKRHSIIIDIQDQTVYAVKGLLSPLPELAKEYSILTLVLLNFQGELIFDGLIQHENLFIGHSMRQSFNELYKAAKLNKTIVYTLPHHK